MLSVKTNRDIEEFKSDFIGGFDVKEALTIGVSLIFGAALMFILMEFTSLPDVMCPYISSPVVIVPIASRFFNKNGMGLKEYKKKTAAFKKGGALQYMSTPMIEHNMEKEDDKFEKTLKKMKIIGFITVITIAVLLAVMLVIKLM